MIDDRSDPNEEELCVGARNTCNRSGDFECAECTMPVCAGHVRFLDDNGDHRSEDAVCSWECFSKQRERRAQIPSCSSCGPFATPETLSFTHHSEYVRGVLGLSFDESWGMDNEWQEWWRCDGCGEHLSPDDLAEHVRFVQSVKIGDEAAPLWSEEELAELSAPVS